MSALGIGRKRKAGDNSSEVIVSGENRLMRYVDTDLSDKGKKTIIHGNLTSTKPLLFTARSSVEIPIAEIGVHLGLLGRDLFLLIIPTCCWCLIQGKL